MPKLKTHRGAAKRFRARKNDFKFRRANRNHILTKASQKVKRHARAQGAIADCDAPAIERMLTGA
jgi:large subunit ribosomal protein L35